MAEDRSFDPWTEDELQAVRQLAAREHEDFFRRNPRLKDAYYDNLIGIFLCQGSASHYLNLDVGIKDIDVWHFYRASDQSPFPHRAKKSRPDGPRGKRVDFLKRAIPREIASQHANPGEVVVAYLRQRRSPLLKKAIIGLYPDSIFMTVFWRGSA